MISTLTKLTLAVVLLLQIKPVFSQAYDHVGQSYIMDSRFLGMGAGASSLQGGINSIGFNPAGILSEEKAQFIGFSDRSAAFTNYLRSGLSYQFSDRVAAAVSYGRTFNKGDEIVFTESNIQSVGIGVSAELLKNIIIGVSTTFLSYELNSKNEARSFFNAGIIKKIQLRNTATYDQFINAGVKYMNLTTTNIPVIGGASRHAPKDLGLGVSYNAVFGKSKYRKKLNTLEILIGTDLVTHDIGFRGGAELLLKEIVALRAGYMSLKNGTNNNLATYGIGFQLPLYKLTDVPLKLNLDASLIPIDGGYVDYDYTYSERKNQFTTFSFKVSWMLEEGS